MGRLDDGVDVTALGGDVGIGKSLAELSDLLAPQTLAQTGHTEEAVTEYGRLADSLSKAGVGGESTNWQFLIDIYEKIVSLAPANKRARPATSFAPRARG